MMSAAHADAHGTEPAAVVLSSTTDARIYLNAFDIPALCYGPRTIGSTRWTGSVELDSIVAGTRTLSHAADLVDPDGAAAHLHGRPHG